MGIKASVVTVTPELAERWLSNNFDNRKISELIVQRYADQMRRGTFLVHNQGIGFDIKGNLIDGQHRLLAVLESGVTSEMLVVRGLAPSVKDVVDTGRHRGPADTLTMLGCKNATIVAGAARLLYHYDNNSMGQLTNPRLRPDNTAIRTIFEANPGLEYSAAIAKRHRILTPSVGAFCHYIFSRLSLSDADTFFDSLIDGTGLTVGSPILILRNRLIDNKSSKTKLSPLDLAALVIKAWCYWREKRKLSFLRWRTGGGSPEQFPTAI